MKDHILIHGRFDLAFEEEESWTLVDFKWSTKPAGPLFEQSVDPVYEKQLKIYQEALSQMMDNVPVKIEQW